MSRMLRVIQRPMKSLLCIESSTAIVLYGFVRLSFSCPKSIMRNTPKLSSVIVSSCKTFRAWPIKTKCRSLRRRSGLGKWRRVCAWEGGGRGTREPWKVPGYQAALALRRPGKTLGIGQPETRKGPRPRRAGGSRAPGSSAPRSTGCARYGFARYSCSALQVFMACS